MSDPVEDAIMALEAKYLPEVMAGKSLMPLYPRSDVAILVKAAVAAEREACLKIFEDYIENRTKRGAFFSGSSRRLEATLRDWIVMGMKTDIAQIIREEAPGCIAEHDRDGHDKLHPSDINAIAEAIVAYIKKTQPQEIATEG